MYECKFPFIEDKSKYTQIAETFEEAIQISKTENTPCVVYSPNGIAIGVTINGKWITIH